MRENEIKLFNSITNIDDSLLDETCGKLKKEKKTVFLKILSSAACICLCIFAILNILMRFDYLGVGCSAYPGDIIDGTYYYEKKHDGIYSYDPENEKTEKLLSTFWYSSYDVNDYGIYYSRGNKLYVMPHEEKEGRRIFKAKGYDRINFSINNNGTLNVTCFDKRNRMKTEILIDAKTGEFIKTIIPEMTFEEAWKVSKTSDIDFEVDGRKLLLKHFEDEYYGIFEDGNNILPKDTYAYDGSYYYSHTGKTIFFDGCRILENDTFVPVIIAIRNSGMPITADFSERSNDSTDDNFIFYTSEQKDKIGCLSLKDKSSWELEIEGKTNVSFYSFTSDGNYIYFTAPWDDAHECWKIERDENNSPYKIVLMNENIAK